MQIARRGLAVVPRPEPGRCVQSRGGPQLVQAVLTMSVCSLVWLG